MGYNKTVNIEFEEYPEVILEQLPKQSIVDFVNEKKLIGVVRKPRVTHCDDKRFVKFLYDYVKTEYGVNHIVTENDLKETVSDIITNQWSLINKESIYEGWGDEYDD